MPEIIIQGKTYQLPDGITIIGRSKDANIAVDSEKLSRAHARIIVEEDTMFIEDLGSRNGTFVNGKRIEEKKELVLGDRVKLGNIDCGIVYPGAASPKLKPVKKPAWKPRLSAEKAALRARRKKKNMIKMVVTLAVLAVAGLVAYSYFKNYVPEELEKARQLLAEAKVQIDAAKPTDHIEKNNELKEGLLKLKDDLEQIPGKFEEEHARADMLMAIMDMKANEISDKNSELKAVQEALSLIDRISEQFNNGMLAYGDAVAGLENLKISYAGTDIAVEAEERVTEIHGIMLSREQEIISGAQAGADKLASSGRFKQALSVLDECMAREFVTEAHNMISTLLSLRQSITAKAEEHFSSLAEKAVQDAHTGDCERLKEALKEEFDAIGFAELEEKYREAVTRIDGIKNERVARAREKVRKELLVIEKQEAKRKYEDASKLYSLLIPMITEPELKKEISKRMHLNNLYVAAKMGIIQYVNARGGVHISNLGYIKRMSGNSVELEIDDQTMPIGWDKIRDSEIMVLLGKVLEKNPDASVYTAYALFLLKRSDENKADEYLFKALAYSKSIASSYPGIFSDYEDRTAKRKEEEKKHEAQRSAEKQKQRESEDIYPPLYLTEDKVQVFIASHPSQFKVYPKHPRLFFRDTDIPLIRKRIKGTHIQEWQVLLVRANKAVGEDPARYAKSTKMWMVFKTAVFAAVITGDERFRKWAFKVADGMVEIGPDQGIDDDYRGRLQCLSIVYDWLYQWLDNEQKKRYQESIIAHIDKNWYFAEKPQFTGGHSRWGNFVLASGLLSLVTERPELRSRLMTVRDNWLNGYYPVMKWIAVDGGYHMGWEYSRGYAGIRNNITWSSATNECLYFPLIEQLPYFWMYGDRGDGYFHCVADAYFNQKGAHWPTVVVAAGLFKDPHAVWYMNRLLKINSWKDRFYDVLYGDKSVKPLAPDDPSNPLPLSRHFRNAGVVLMRNRWDEDTTLLHFKCTSFQSINHHHRDENGFTLSYRGRLAIDSGSYEIGSGYGSVHWHNYYTRTIAHNSITVFDPGEVFGTSPHGQRSTDGGQQWIRSIRRLEEIAPGGRAHIDGIIAYGEGATYAYAKGDATKAYSAHKMQLFVRSVVYLRKPLGWQEPVAVIFDHVTGKNAKFVKRFLLHSIYEPTVTENRIEIVEERGKLHCITVLPLNPKIEKIGGPGKQFWVDGKNYGLNMKGLNEEQVYRQTGQWRAEVMPRIPAKEDFFLHVLAVCKKENSSPPPKSVLVDSGAFKGVIVAGHAVLFDRTEHPLARGSYELPGRGARVHILCGVLPSTGYILRLRNSTVSKAVSTEGGSVMFSVSSGSRGPFSFTAAKID